MSRYLVEPDPFPPLYAARHRVEVRVAARTDRGLERAKNEDHAIFADLGTNVVFEPPATTILRPEAGAFVALVCDGMGGEAGGEIASRLAIEAVPPFLRTFAPTGSGEGHIARALVASIEAASSQIKEEARRQPLYGRMGTTATLAAIADGSLVCAQVGDSRAYLHRRGVLTQITHDQTMAELLRASGTIPLDQIHEVVGAHVILQAVGSSARLDVAITHTPLENDDTILLCSDGLSGVVPDPLIAKTLGDHHDPDKACAALIAEALAAGAPDNVTCLVFRVTQT